MRKTKAESYELVRDLISHENFEKEIKKRADDYNQLLDEDAIGFLIADEMGRNVGHVSTIRELKDGEEATIYAAVTKIFEPRIFEKNGRKGKVVNLEIRDKTGDCRLVLWNKDVELVEKGIIKDNTVLKVVNGYIKKTGNIFEINVGRWGAVIPESKDAAEFASQIPSILGKNQRFFPSDATENVKGVFLASLEKSKIFPEDTPKGLIKVNFIDLSDIKPGMNVNVVGTIISKNGLRSFVRKNGSTGFISKIMINDGTGASRVVLWDERAKETAKFEIGDNIEIREGYTKLDNDAEIHVGSRGTIKKR